MSTHNICFFVKKLEIVNSVWLKKASYPELYNNDVRSRYSLSCVQQHLGESQNVIT